MKLRNVNLAAGKTSSPALVSHLVVLLALGAACEPLTDEMVVQGTPSRVLIQEQAPGADCEYGGQRIDAGIDDNLNGQLDEAEFDQVRYVCNGAPGSAGDAGPAGATALVSVEAEAAGANCALGGNKVSSGLDSDSSGVLDAAEVTSVQYVCNGAPGVIGTNALVLVEAVGADVCPVGGQRIITGSDIDGNGELSGSEIASAVVVCDGAAGANGADAVSALVRQEVEPVGEHCAWGGSAIHVGLDDDHSLTLEQGEIDSTSYVCNGADGVNSLFKLTPIPSGNDCETGGTLIETGLDVDRDSELSAGEVSASRTLCNGLTGDVGLQSLVRVSDQSPGVECAAGGKKLESGVDSSGDGELAVGEISHTAYLCNGVDGIDGVDGLSALVSVSDEAPGLTCAAGGKKLETGIDASGNGSLELGEVTATEFVCDGIDGIDGTDGFDALVAISDVSPGIECSAGGKKVENGLDTSRNGSLEPGEVGTTNYVCNGVDGTDGTNGTNGQNSLISVSNELPGEDCALGGQKIDVGRDVNGNLTLDLGEIEQTRFVCNGGGFLLRAGNEEPGLNCAYGGVKLETGTDVNSDNVLDAGEIVHTDYVCNQDRGLIVPMLADLVSLGSNSTCAAAEGETYCWGYNGNGQLLDAVAPRGFVGQTSLGAVQALSVGHNHACAVQDGAVFCWGYNGNGQLGNGTTGGNLGKVEAGSFTDATAVSATSNQSCAVAGGKAYCWGYNGDGRLGDGTTTNRTTPTEVPGLTNVTSISAGPSHACAVSNGNPFCWGYNGNGQLGDNSTTTRLSPVAVSGLTGVTQIQAGEQTSCALTDAGTVRCWGYNGHGQLGNGNTSQSSVPVSVSNLSEVTQVAISGYHACAVTGGGVFCWGNNGNGQLGDGTTTNRSTPVAATGLSATTAISTNYNHSCAINDGAVKCWGSNGNGQLGIGGFDGNYLTPLSARKFVDLAP